MSFVGRRPSQKVKVLKRERIRLAIARMEGRRPSQKVKVLKLYTWVPKGENNLESQTFPEGKGVETRLSATQDW